MQEDIECVFESMTGRGSIYISNLPAAQNVQLLHSKGIKAILSVARSGLCKHKKQDIPHYLFIPAEDHKDYELSQHFEDTFQFIEKSRKQTNVLVHCMVGVSRSVTIVIAYLLKKYKYTLEQVLSMIYRKRRKINPNKGFIEQLKRYAQNEGIKCEMRGDYLEVLRGRSASRNKRGISHDKIKKVFTMGIRQQLQEADHKTIKNEIKQDHNIEYIPEPKIHMRKLTSYDETMKISIENQECELDKVTKDKEVRTCIVEKKSVSAVKERGRGLSIEQKIKKVRDRIMKKQEAARDTMKNSGQHNPIYRKSPKKLEQSLLEKQNRGNCQQFDVTKSVTPVITDKKELKQSLRPSNIAINRPNAYSRAESAQKDIFSQELKIQISTLYSPMRAKRGNTRLQ